MWNVIGGFDTLVTDYHYNSQDQITHYSHSRLEEEKTFANIYDYAGRLSKVVWYVTLPDSPDPQSIDLTEYTYNENSQVLQQLFHDGSIKKNFSYTNRNWISECSSGMFGYINDYFKNGNVKSQTLEGTYNDDFSYTNDLTFNYMYDKSNRLLKSSRSGGKSYEVENSYDSAGNITKLKRYNSLGSATDDFVYTYYSGTNKLQRVYGSTGNQFVYDANGNLIQDALNNNKEMLYDHRNLITELKHRSQIIGDPVYLTKYYYDESGNRIRKMTYQYIGSLAENEPPANSDVSNTLEWVLVNDEIYSRDVSGRELAIFKDNEVEEYPLYGLDMIGRIVKDIPNYYYTDHLGSIRAVVNPDNELVSAQDYDQWGYLLSDRIFESNVSKFKFTSKESDQESFYDYFGARYYDSRVGRWGSIDPLFEEHIDFNPYNYVLDNSMVLVDPNGKQVFVAFGGLADVSDSDGRIPIGDYTDEDPTGSEILINLVSKYSKENNIGNAKMSAYFSTFGGGEIYDANEFIQNNLTNNTEPIILYGYSLGGYNINELVNMLAQSSSIKNDIILITVDAYSPEFDAENPGLVISSRVSININYWQETAREIIGSRGFPARSESGKNNVLNILVKDTDHGKIDEKIALRASGIIVSYLNRWREK